MSRFNGSGHAVLNGSAHDDPPSPKKGGGPTKGGQDGIPPTFHAKPSGVPLTLDEAKKKLESLFKETSLTPTDKQRESMICEVLKIINNPALPPHERIALKESREKLQADRLKMVAEMKKKLRNTVKEATAEAVVETKPSPSKHRPTVNHN